VRSYNVILLKEENVQLHFFHTFPDSHIHNPNLKDHVLVKQAAGTTNVFGYTYWYSNIIEAIRTLVFFKFCVS